MTYGFVDSNVGGAFYKSYFTGIYGRDAGVLKKRPRSDDYLGRLRFRLSHVQFKILEIAQKWNIIQRRF